MDFFTDEIIKAINSYEKAIENQKAAEKEALQKRKLLESMFDLEDQFWSGEARLEGFVRCWKYFYDIHKMKEDEENARRLLDYEE